MTAIIIVSFISITTMILFFRTDVKEENNLGWGDELLEKALKEDLYEY